MQSQSGGALRLTASLLALLTRKVSLLENTLAAMNTDLFSRLDLFRLWGTFRLRVVLLSALQVGLVRVLVLQAARFLRGPASGSGLFSFIAPLFYLLVVANLCGLTPFTFAYTRQFWFCATLSVGF